MTQFGTKLAAPTEQTVSRMLSAQRKTNLALAVVSIVSGIGASLASSAVAASIVWYCLYSFLKTSYIGWLGWFLVFDVTLIPLLMWFEGKTPRSYFNAAASSSVIDPSSYGEYRLARSRLEIAAYAGMLAWGPRSLVGGLRSLRHCRQATPQSVSRAARLVIELAKMPHGVPVKTLMEKHESMPNFGAAVDLLDDYGWIGRASDSTTIWLDSTYRRKLSAKI